MKFSIILVSFLCYTIVAKSQDAYDYAEVDKVALDIPAAKTNTTSDIASYIKDHFTTDNKRVRAVYTWVTNNIKYSTDSLHLVILNEDNEQKITNSLRRKKGVCENYAAIFNDICLKSGLRSFVIEGYTKQYGSLDRSGHAWCTVFIDNNWLLYDPTWDANTWGSFYNGHVKDDYFQVPAAVFIETHMPFDPMFQMLNYPVTYKEFDKGNIQINSNKPYFDYADSIFQYERSNPLNQYLSASSRIENNGSAGSMTKDKLGKLKMEMEIIHQDKDAALYNSAVADYNEAIAIFNSFLTYRNNQFKPAKTNDEVQAMLNSVEKRVTEAKTKLREVNNSKAVLTLNTGSVEKVLNDLQTHVKEQRVFMNNYLGSQVKMN